MTPNAIKLLEEVKRNIEAMDRYLDMTWDIEDIHTLWNLLLMYEECKWKQFWDSLQDRINNLIN